MANKGFFHILVYHRLGSANSLDGLTISKESFSEQMAAIKRHYKPELLGNLVRRILGHQSIPAKAVAVTFDDGYADTFNIALPILRRSDIPATVFITTGYIDRSTPSYQKSPMMSWAMIRKMQHAGIEIGSHTLTHPNLIQCSLHEARHQLVKSKERLEYQLGKKVELLAYPYGGIRSFNGMIQKLAEEAGFLGACTTLPGSNGLGSDLYALRRMAPLRDEIYRMALQLDQASRGNFLKSKSAMHGISAKTIKIWTSQYKTVRHCLLNKKQDNRRNKRLLGF